MRSTTRSATARTSAPQSSKIVPGRSRRTSWPKARTTKEAIVIYSSESKGLVALVPSHSRTPYSYSCYESLNQLISSKISLPRSSVRNKTCVAHLIVSRRSGPAFTSFIWAIQASMVVSSIVSKFVAQQVSSRTNVHLLPG